MSKSMIQDAVEAQIKTSKVMDAGDGVFFARELEYIKAKPYNKKYAGIEFRDRFPISHEAGEGAQTITYQSYDHTGQSKLIDSYATDLPRADIRGKEVPIPVKQYGIQYGYSTEEIRASQMAGKGLDAKRATAAMEGNERTFDAIAFDGNEDEGLYGLFTFPNIPLTTVATGAAAGTEWSTKTAEEILYDMNNAVSVMADTTKMVEVPDTLMLPVSQYNYIRQTARSSVSDKTILQYFKDNNPDIEVVPSNRIKGKGTGGAEVMVLYRNDPDAISVEIPMEFKQHAPQLKSLRWDIPCEAKIGGFLAYYPLSVAIWEGI